MKILLWKIGALGDVLMTTPLIRMLRDASPDAEIDYLVGQSSAIVLEGNPRLNRVIRFNEKILYERRVGEVGSIVQALRGYDVVFVLDKHWIFALLARLANVPRRIGFARGAHEGWLHTQKVSYGALRHEIDYYLDLGQLLGAPAAPVAAQMELPPSVAHAIETPYTVLINSGGANAFELSSVRRMPPPLFADLVSACAERGRVVFLGSSAERNDYERYATPATLNLCGQTSLPQAWSVLEGAQHVYSTDTGLMHMAAAAGASLTAVFGPTHPLRKCPPGASWAWVDEAIYQPDYELSGRIPSGSYFRGLRAEDILAAQARQTSR
jgi:ADP-heptose:LPS heptosyltransferase